MSYRKIRAQITGPGGIRCACCTIGTPTEHKRFSERRVRRALNPNAAKRRAMVTEAMELLTTTNPEG